MNTYKFSRNGTSTFRIVPGEILSGGDPAWTFCAGMDDHSPDHSTYPTGYDSRCTSCYLNHPHTDAYHNVQIMRARARATR